MAWILYKPNKGLVKKKKIEQTEITCRPTTMAYMVNSA